MALADDNSRFEVVMSGQTTTAGSDINETNMTTPRDLGEIDKAWYIVYNVILVAITIVCMFSMGTAIKLNYLKTIIRRPVAPAIGAISQVQQQISSSATSSPSIASIHAIFASLFSLHIQCLPLDKATYCKAVVVVVSR